MGDPSVPSSVAGDEPMVAQPAQPAAPRRQDEGPLRIFLVVGSSSGRYGDFGGPTLPGHWPDGAEYVLAGVVLAHSWLLVEAGSAPTDAAHSHMRASSIKQCRGARDVLGFIDYPVAEAAALEAPAAVDGAAAALMQCRRLSSQRVRVATPGSTHPATEDTLGDVLKRWQTLLRKQKPPTVVLLAVPMAELMVTGGAACLHVAAITRKVARQANLLVASEPPPHSLRHFVQNATDQRARPTSNSSQSLQLPKWADAMIDPELVIEWLSASAYIRHNRQAPNAAAAFARLLARSSGVPLSQLVNKMQTLSYTTLRGARIKLDVAAMMIWREMWVSLLSSHGDDLHLYIYCDASPQRGAELFATSVDVFDGKVFRRWLLPCVSLHPALMDAVGKNLALLWQVFLVAGPHLHLAQAFCNRVRSITTDMGTERLIADSPFALDLLVGAVAPQSDPGGATDEAWSWPNAIHVPGWKHAWDLILQKGLSSLRWFPAWLARLKGVIAFLRQEGRRATMADHLRTLGKSGLADVVASTSLPSFAHWRWTTLHDCLKSLQPFLRSMATHFDARWFAKAKDTTGLSTMVAAMSSQEWHKQTDFVWYFAREIDQLMSWGSGCSCHEAELRAGQAVTCGWKGRRLAEAQPHLSGELNRMLAEAETWNEARWGLGLPALLELQGVVRATHHLVHRKFEWLRKVPYLLARVGQEGVVEECLRQWDAIPPERHHRVTRSFLAPGSVLRAAMDRALVEGVSPRLQAAVDSLRAMPFDDGVNEGPHAQAQRFAAHARRACWPWIAASMRLQQNLQDAREMAPAIDVSLRSVWSQWTSLLCVGGRHQLVRQRVKRQKFIDNIYRMAFFFEHTRIAEAQGGGPPVDDGALGDGVGHDSRTPLLAQGPRAGRPPQDLRTIRTEVQARVGTLVRREPSRPAQRAGDEDLCKLLRQYLAASLQTHSFYSVRATDLEGVNDTLFFQVLAVETRGIFVKTAVAPDDMDYEEGLFRISAQTYLQTGVRIEGESPPKSAQCFAFEDPCFLDLLAVGGCQADCRNFWKKWEVTESDVDGVLRFHSPQPLRPAMKLDDAKVPVLALLDALDGLGFRSAEGQVRHTRRGKQYDGRNLTSKRFYLQCVLAIPDLSKAGVSAFDSGRPGSYYALLLKSKKLPPPGISDKDCKKQLALLSDDVVAMHLLDEAVPPAAFAQPQAPPAAAPPLLDLDSVAGDPEEEVPEALAAPLVENFVVGGEDVAGDSVPEGAALGDGVPREISGQRVTRVSGRHDGTWSYNDRISVRCCNPRHPTCSKSRSLTLDRDVFGPRAAEYFLGAWLSASDLPEAAHKRFVPSRAEVRSYMESFAACAGGE